MKKFYFLLFTSLLFLTVTKQVFSEEKNIFPMNDIWNKLIIDKKLQGQLASSDILHIGDKRSFDDF